MIGNETYAPIKVYSAANGYIVEVMHQTYVAHQEDEVLAHVRKGLDRLKEVKAGQNLGLAALSPMNAPSSTNVAKGY